MKYKVVRADEEQTEIENKRNFERTMRKPTEQRSRIPCVKYCIFGVNLVMVVVGFCLLALGLWLKLDHRFRDFLSERYRNVVDDDFWDAPTLYIFAYVIIVVGACMVLVSFFGCCGVIRESQCLLISYFLCVLVLFAASMTSGIYLFMKHDAIENEVTDALTFMVSRYYQGAGVIQETLDALQEAFRCCGNSGCGDFIERGWHMPRSCDPACDGCRYRMFKALREGFIIVAVIFTIVLLAQLLGMIMSLYLFCRVNSARNRARLYYWAPADPNVKLGPPGAGAAGTEKGHLVGHPMQQQMNQQIQINQPINKSAMNRPVPQQQQQVAYRSRDEALNFGRQNPSYANSYVQAMEAPPPYYPNSLKRRER